MSVVVDMTHVTNTEARTGCTDPADDAPAAPATMRVAGFNTTFPYAFADDNRTLALTSGALTYHFARQ